VKPKFERLVGKGLDVLGEMGVIAGLLSVLSVRREACESEISPHGQKMDLIFREK
jgi:hypothetical protein